MYGWVAAAVSDGTAHVWNATQEWRQATSAAMPEGWVTFLPDGRYKYGGEIAGGFWHAINLCRFEPGELDPYWHTRLRIEPEESLWD